MTLRAISSALAFACLFVAACSSGPGAKLLDRPVATHGFKSLLDPRKYSEITRRVLGEQGLEREAKSDPRGVVNQLMGSSVHKAPVDARIAAAEVALKAAYDWQGKDIEAAMGLGLASIEISQTSVGMAPSQERTRLLTLYNEACGAFAWSFHQNRGAGSEPCALQGLTGARRVTWAPAGDGRADAGYFDSIKPSSFLKVDGFNERYQRQGVGGSVVGRRRAGEQRFREDPFMSPVGYAVALTSVVKVEEDGRARIHLYSLDDTNETALFGRRQLLTADFTAPIATLMESAPGSKVGFFGMVKPSRYAEMEGLYQIGPWRGGRTPLILAHGLMSSPATWREIVTACYADPFLRENYQIMTFYYPTGYPIPRNAALLRGKLRELREHYDPKRRDPAMNRMVLIGHSMGGILSNYQIRPGGDPLWNQLFTRPIGEIGMTGEERRVIDEMIYFEANPDIGRAIFVCSPHRGSQYADFQIGRIGSRLINFSTRMLEGASTELRDSTTELGTELLAKPKTSIDNLQVDSVVLTTILEQPVTHGTPFHSIIGDRGKGDSPDSSDGVVPYWSSHLDAAASERIVPSDHNATNNPDTVGEVRRILYLHLGRKEVPPL